MHLPVDTQQGPTCLTAAIKGPKEGSMPTERLQLQMA